MNIVTMMTKTTSITSSGLNIIALLGLRVRYRVPGHRDRSVARDYQLQAEGYYGIVCITCHTGKMTDKRLRFVAETVFHEGNSTNEECTKSGQNVGYVRG